MEFPSNDKKITHKPPRQKGGLKTMPFVIANEAFEKVASYGLQANMVLYLKDWYMMDSDTATAVLLLWSFVSNLMPLVGAFVSDSYLGRFRVISLASFSSLLGMSLLWLTTMIPGATPHSCNLLYFEDCSPTTGQLALLFSAFGLMSIGSGGVRPCALSFGADQFDKEDNPKNERVLQTFFNWYYASVGVSLILALTVIVYIQHYSGWKIGFGVPVILMSLSAVLFLLGSSLYVKKAANKSLFTGIVQVIVVSYKNKHLVFPPRNTNGWYHYVRGSKFVAPTDKLRCLNKACIIRNPQTDLKPDGSALRPWDLCTVEQVEALKSLMRVIPLWSTGIIIAMVITQNSVLVLQGRSMNGHITSKIEIPPGSIHVFALLTLAIWVAIYDRIIVPLLAKFVRPNGLTHLQRMGTGLLFSCAATAVAAIVESIRRNAAIKQGISENERAVVDMSIMWLVPQQCLIGLAEAFNTIGQIEFYYSQFPKSMSSIAGAILAVGLAVASLLGSVLIKILNGVSARGGNEKWLSNNLNKGHYDYYYWLLTVLGLLNFMYFLGCSRAYGGCEEEGTKEEELCLWSERWENLHQEKKAPDNI